MKETCLTVAELQNACKNNRYILVRQYNGELVGMNCGLADFIFKVKPHLTDTSKTAAISYIPCDFMTYITYKTPFLKNA